MEQIRDEPIFLPKDRRVQQEILESLLVNLTPENVSEVSERIKYVQFENLEHLECLMAVIVKFVIQNPDKVKEYASLCEELEKLKVTTLLFVKIDEQETLQFINYYLLLLVPRIVRWLYDKLLFFKATYKYIFKPRYVNDFRIVKYGTIFIGELHKHHLAQTDLLLSLIDGLSNLVGTADFFLNCMVSLMEQTAEDIEANGYSISRYFKQLRHIVSNSGTLVQKDLIKRIKNFLKLRATKQLDGEEVPSIYVKNIIEDGIKDGKYENYEETIFSEIKEELAKDIEADQCKSCSSKFKSQNLYKSLFDHLISKQHMTSVQKISMERYIHNLMYDHLPPCIVCREFVIQKPFTHLQSQEHRKNSKLVCLICQLKFTSKLYLAMHLKSLSHKKRILKIYDSIFYENFFGVFLRKEVGLEDSDSDDENEIYCRPSFGKYLYELIMIENGGLKDNITKYFDFIITNNNNINQDEALHKKFIQQLERFIGNIYISKRVSRGDTITLLNEFKQEFEDVKDAVKCLDREFWLLNEEEEMERLVNPKLSNLLKKQYAKVDTNRNRGLEIEKGSGAPSVQDKTAVGESSKSTTKVEDNKSKTKLNIDLRKEVSMIFLRQQIYETEYNENNIVNGIFSETKVSFFSDNVSNVTLVELDINYKNERDETTTNHFEGLKSSLKRNAVSVQQNTEPLVENINSSKPFKKLKGEESSNSKENNTNITNFTTDVQNKISEDKISDISSVHQENPNSNILESSTAAHKEDTSHIAISNSSRLNNSDVTEAETSKSASNTTVKDSYPATTSSVSQDDQSVTSQVKSNFSFVRLKEYEKIMKIVTSKLRSEDNNDVEITNTVFHFVKKLIQEIYNNEDISLLIKLELVERFNKNFLNPNLVIWKKFRRKNSTSH